jgi:hypothetical protein
MVVLIEGKVLFTFRRSGWFDIFMDFRGRFGLIYQLSSGTQLDYKSF